MTANSNVHLIGNAHLDPVWLWQWQEGYAEIKATFRSALDRLNEFPDFVFTCACAAYYKWVEENAPEMFDEIRARVAEGQWVIVGGWWIQPDCNLPSGESFARHGLYGQRYFQEKFGVMARVGYNVDSFGHHGMLPQILRQSGMDYYVFMRPMEHEKQLPHNLFWWESEDGSRVMTFRLSDGYCTRGDDEALWRHIGQHKQMAETCEYPYMSFYGVGNHGGGPTIAQLQAIGKLQERYAPGELALSSPNAYFAQAAALNPDIPVMKEDMQMHAVGCYSTHSESKRNNRRAEHRLLSAEKFASLANMMLALPYPQEQLKQAWENVMFNQFHDIMGGCSIREAFDDVRESHGESLHIAARALNAALQKISWSIDTMKPQIKSLSKEKDWHLWEQDECGTPLVVFNPLPWEVEVPVQIDKQVAAVSDEAGEALPIQTVRASRTNLDDKWDTLFLARIPAMGYRVYWAYLDKPLPPAAAAASLAVSETLLENDYVRVEFEPHTGYIRRLLDKRNNVEAIAGRGAVPLVIDEFHSDTWGHGLDEYRDVIGRFEGAELKVLERGPLRAVIRVTSRYNDSVLRQDFVLRHDSADLLVNVRLDWREKHKMLKLSFPVRVDEPQAVWEIPYGYIARTVNGKEVPGLQWLDVSGSVATESGVAGTGSAEAGTGAGGVAGIGATEAGKGAGGVAGIGAAEAGAGAGGVTGTGAAEAGAGEEITLAGAGDGNAARGAWRTFGLALLNDAKYAYDVLGNDMRMTVVRSPIYADHFGQRDDQVEYMDQGVQRFSYSLVPHAGSWQDSGIVRKAYELNVPPALIWETYHEGPLPQSGEGIRVSSDQIVVSAFKLAEDGDGWILRCYETAGRETEATFEIPALGRRWSSSFSRSQIRTFHIPHRPEREVAAVDFIERQESRG